uniref:(northern house mosquito) hypothetical protein n=1 Tax=Culex pipiens TaxID=7175 RepID=A0A8D8PIM7_CULPI
MHPTNVSEEVLIMNLNLVEVAILAIVDGTTGDVSFLSDAFRHQILNFSRINHSLIHFLFHSVYAVVSRLTIRSFHLLIDGFHCRTEQLRGPFCKILSQRIALHQNLLLLLRWTIHEVQIVFTRDPVFSRFLRVNRVKVSIKVVRIELRLKVKAKLGADPALVLLSVELDVLLHRGIDPRRGVRG